MNIESFTSGVMQKVVALTKRRENLLEEVKEIDADITALFGGGASRRTGRKGRPPKAAAAQVPEKRGRKGDRGQKPGALKERILAVLEKAGDNGISVADIASDLGVPKANVHVWFSTTGKRLNEVKKMEPGRFRFHGKKK